MASTSSCKSSGDHHFSAYGRFNGQGAQSQAIRARLGPYICLVDLMSGLTVVNVMRRGIDISNLAILDISYETVCQLMLLLEIWRFRSLLLQLLCQRVLLLVQALVRIILMLLPLIRNHRHLLMLSLVLYNFSLLLCIVYLIWGLPFLWSLCCCSFCILSNEYFWSLIYVYPSMLWLKGFIGIMRYFLVIGRHW